MSQEKKKALGKGLESLLPRKPQVVARAMSHGGNGSAAPANGGNGSAGLAASGEAGLSEANKAAIAREMSPAYQYVGPELDGDFAPGVRPEVYEKAMKLVSEHYAPELAAEFKTHRGDVVVEVPLRLIERNPYQTRVTGINDPNLDELTASIAAQGVLEPILVRPMKQAGPTGQLYQLIAGERRWLASRKAGKVTIPAIVRDVSDEQVMVMTIIENLLRQDLNPMQHARAFRRLGDEFRLTQEEIAKKTGMSRPTVGNYLRLTRLPEAVQTAMQEGRLSFGHAKVLMQLPTDEDVATLAHKVVAGNLTVRETELLVEDFARPVAASAAPERRVDPNVRAAEVELQRSLGCRVQIKDRNGKGKIVIEYRSLEDFDRVIEALK